MNGGVFRRSQEAQDPTTDLRGHLCETKSKCPRGGTLSIVLGGRWGHACSVSCLYNPTKDANLSDGRAVQSRVHRRQSLASFPCSVMWEYAATLKYAPFRTKVATTAALLFLCAASCHARGPEQMHASPLQFNSLSFGFISEAPRRQLLRLGSSLPLFTSPTTSPKSKAFLPLAFLAPTWGKKARPMGERLAKSKANTLPDLLLNPLLNNPLLWAARQGLPLPPLLRSPCSTPCSTQPLLLHAVREVVV